MTNASPAPDFWASSGHHLLDRDAAGHLVITDEFLKLYLARSEVIPPDDACIVERALYQKLARAPRASVATAEIRDIADRDARENWQHLIAFRDGLLAAPTLEAAYINLVRAANVTTPPLFLNQLVHVIARNMLDGERDPYVLRAAELLFRPQRLTVKDGVMLLADEELVDGSNVVDHASPLVAIFGDAKARNIDVMTADNAEGYFDRSDGFDMALDFRHGRPARIAFARRAGALGQALTRARRQGRGRGPGRAGKMVLVRRPRRRGQPASATPCGGARSRPTPAVIASSRCSA